MSTATPDQPARQRIDSYLTAMAGTPDGRVIIELHLVDDQPLSLVTTPGECLVLIQKLAPAVASALQGMIKT